MQDLCNILYYWSRETAVALTTILKQFNQYAEMACAQSIKWQNKSALDQKSFQYSETWRVFPSLTEVSLSCKIRFYIYSFVQNKLDFHVKIMLEWYAKITEADLQIHASFY